MYKDSFLSVSISTFNI